MYLTPGAIQTRLASFVVEFVAMKLNIRLKDTWSQALFKYLVILSPTLSLFLGLTLLTYLWSLSYSGRVARAYVWRFIYRLLFGMENLISRPRAEALDRLISSRDTYDEREDHQMDPHGQPLPMPLRPYYGNEDAGPYAIQVSIRLKAEGLGSLGLDTVDNRRIAYLRAVDIMRAHGVRPSHIAKSAVVAVSLAFVPTPHEILAKQIDSVMGALDRKEATSRVWRDERVLDLPGPVRTYN